MEWKWNRNGMEKNYYPGLEVKLNGMEWKRNGNGMERLWQTVILIFDFGNGMEWKWKWNGTPDYKYGISIWKNYEFHAIPLEFHSTQFHSVPWNSTFHLEMETSAAKGQLTIRLVRGLWD